MPRPSFLSEAASFTGSLVSGVVKGVSNAAFDTAKGTLDLGQTLLKPVTNTAQNIIMKPVDTVKDVAKVIAHPVLAAEQLALDTKKYGLNIRDGIRNVADKATFGTVLPKQEYDYHDIRQYRGPLEQAPAVFGGKKSIKNRRKQKRNSKNTNLRKKSRK